MLLRCSIPSQHFLLAGNVVQFVQFRCTLAVIAQEVHSSKHGTFEDSLEMKSVTSRLLGTVRDLETHLASVGPSNFSRLGFEVISACNGDCRRMQNDSERYSGLVESDEDTLTLVSMDLCSPGVVNCVE